VLLLTGDLGAPDTGITATVQVRAQGLGTHHQACTEQVNLRAGGYSVNRLPFAVRALLIGDLPTNLWWASNQPPPLAGALLYDLAEQAQQIMYDSIGWPEPAKGISVTATWLEQVERASTGGRWRVASDLNWRRLKYWRRLVTQCLDPASAPGALESITEVRVEHGPHAVIQAWELISWLAYRLGWIVVTGRTQQGTELSWRLNGEHGDLRVFIKRLDQGPPAICRVRITSMVEDRPAVFNLSAESDQRLAIRLEGEDAAVRTVTIPAHSAADVVGRQLSDRAPDPVFRASMEVAEILARTVLR
jgi:glucose-6-phosphate dehydrogenase assembly protein OpcA